MVRLNNNKNFHFNKYIFPTRALKGKVHLQCGFNPYIIQWLNDLNKASNIQSHTVYIIKLFYIIKHDKNNIQFCISNTTTTQKKKIQCLFQSRNSNINVTLWYFLSYVGLFFQVLYKYNVNDKHWEHYCFVSIWKLHQENIWGRSNYSFSNYMYTDQKYSFKVICSWFHFS